MRRALHRLTNFLFAAAMEDSAEGRGLHGVALWKYILVAILLSALVVYGYYHTIP